ncbi:MAG: hypothetical protein ACKVZH_05380 [Blastocatellia bacterium]
MRSTKSILEMLGVRTDGEKVAVETLPFSRNDITAGSESELQTVVIGNKADVDLPQQIEQSNFYANAIRRIATGDTPRRAITELEDYLNDNSAGVWENSWVRFPRARLSRFTEQTFQTDLLADKRDSRRGLRSDSRRFLFIHQGEEWVRLPVSYLLKLSLAEAIGSQPNLPGLLETTGIELMQHFLSDNTSPETFSFNVMSVRPESGMGRTVAREKAKRFLFCQLLVTFADLRFGLRANGQQTVVYFAPHPPTRQKQLNDCISDAFYRELFMSPCLSGWDDGEAKHDYMKLCHQALSRSQLNAVAKLREAGIVVNNLVVLPNVSNISLANNGTHVSLGSRRLTEARRFGQRDFGVAEEKQVGDLAIKIVEHFLPLFVGAYSAAPYRLDFTDFHPERALGFLPHELDYTHLRMIWRRWRKKADLNFFGYRLTPFGPLWLDRLLSKVFRLKGDCVADFRLIDYLAAVMSTERSPAFDGSLGNGDRLKRDLADLGIFDAKMSLYVLYRLREFEQMGFTGFEGRYYSLFESFSEDMTHAVNLQSLVTALAFKYQATGQVTHASIPDEPFIESERRQAFFGAAIGIPTFYVRHDTGNRLLNAILARTKRSRQSRRYQGFIRVRNDDYCRALLQTLREDAADLIEMFGIGNTINNLQARLDNPREHSASGKLVRGILGDGKARSPLDLSAREFNLQAEHFYRNDLRRRHIAEAFAFLLEELGELSSSPAPEIRHALHTLCGERDLWQQVAELQPRVQADEATESELLWLMNLMLASIAYDRGHSAQIQFQQAEWPPPAEKYYEQIAFDGAPVC